LVSLDEGLFSCLGESILRKLGTPSDKL
jgi:hypothetical protein